MLKCVHSRTIYDNPREHKQVQVSISCIYSQQRFKSLGTISLLDECTVIWSCLNDSETVDEGRFIREFITEAMTSNQSIDLLNYNHLRFKYFIEPYGWMEKFATNPFLISINSIMEINTEFDWVHRGTRARIISSSKDDFTAFKLRYFDNLNDSRWGTEESKDD